MAEPAVSPTARQPWVWFGVAGLVIAATSRLLPSPARDIVFASFGPAAAVAIVLGVRLHRPAAPLPWYLLAASQAVWGIADGISWAYSTFVDDSAFPTPSDAVYLTGYVLAAVGLALLVRSRSARRDAAGNLDAAILTSALGLLSWVVLARPTAELYRDSVLDAAVGIAYPVADIVLVALLLRLQTVAPPRSRAFRFLVYGLALLVLADTLATAGQLLTWTSSAGLEIIWLASYLAMGVAGLDPTMTAVSAGGRGEGYRELSRVRLVALLAAVLVPPAVLLAQAASAASVEEWAIGLGAGIISVLVMARLLLGVRQLERLHTEREGARLALAHQATHDPLTGLPNRAQALTLLRGALNRARRTGALVGVLFVDLDGFKQVNDTLGHQAGDEVLAATADRMQRSVRAGDVVARLGGDEFVVLLETLDDEANAVRVASRLVADIAEPIWLSTGREARIGASIGLAVNVDSSVDADRLLQEADEAVFRAKAAGRGRVEVFAPSLRAEMERRASATAVIAAALQHDTPELSGAPLVHLASGRQVGVEVDVAVPGPSGERWTRSQVLADVEGTDIVCDLDGWVLRNLARATDGADDDRLIVVPVTWRHLAQGLLLADVTVALEQGVAPAGLMLRVPAEDVLDDVRVLAVLEQLSRLGVGVCADGFGAGDSGTDRWGNLPLDYVRLDRRLLTGPAGDVLVRLTVETANAFGYSVIAPGIADADEAERLARAGCDLGQGPLYGEVSLNPADRVFGVR